jgi:DNA-binding transcriptional ArsR family regulator
LIQPPFGVPQLNPSRARIRATIASVVDQPEELRQLRLVHKALADVNRLRIVQRLARGHASVTDLIEHVGLSQPLVSWHVSRLRAAGLIETRRNGRETLCRLRPEAFEAFAARQRVILGLSDAPTGVAS